MNTQSLWQGKNPLQTQAWRHLDQQFTKEKSLSISKLFAQEPNRQKQLSFSAAGLTVDFSKQRISHDGLQALVALADECEISRAKTLLMSGDPINHTEKRSALHAPLRNKMAATPEYQDVVNQAFEKVKALSSRLRNGDWLGHNGQVITDVVNIGIGGSDLGPRMVCDALKPWHSDNLNVHFVANIDPCDFNHAVKGLNPDTTLFVICSKTFSTLETRENAMRARAWIREACSDDSKLERHFIGVSANVDGAIAFGISAEHILPIWDWIGGRYSLWSAIGFSIACAIGYDAFSSLLEGAAEMDHHFLTEPAETNIPTIMGLLDIWHCNFWKCQSQAVLPYCNDLKLFPEYLQQLTMESNGKSVDREGKPIEYQTSPVFWGVAGTMGQHSFHQMLHQGTRFIPVDFILPLKTSSTNPDQHRHLVANCLAQAQALLEGKPVENATRENLEKNIPEEEAKFLAQHRAVPGNRPSTIIGMQALTPKTLGALIAAYEHRVFVSSVIWNINAFDQWGVELGKQLSAPLYKALEKEDTPTVDDSTAFWIGQYHQANR